MTARSALRLVLLMLALFAAGAQSLCASADMALGGAAEHAVHHVDADHDHEDGATCAEACAAHHLVLLPVGAGLAALPTRAPDYPFVQAGFRSGPASGPEFPPRNPRA